MYSFTNFSHICSPTHCWRLHIFNSHLVVFSLSLAQWHTRIWYVTTINTSTTLRPSHWPESPIPHLDLDIHVADPKETNHHMTICAIILENEWCSTIKTTHTDGFSCWQPPKPHLLNTHKWLDESLEPLFTCYLTKNQNFQSHLDYPIPQCTDRISCNEMTKQDAAKLMHSIPNYGNTNKDSDKFSKFPMKHHNKNPKYMFNEKNFPTLKIPMPSTSSTNDTNQQTISTTPPAAANKPTANNVTTHNKQPVNLKALQVQIQKNLATDFTKLINAKIEDFHMDFKDSFAKLDYWYDEFSAMVTLLTQQQQSMYLQYPWCHTKYFEDSIFLQRGRRACLNVQ